MNLCEKWSVLMDFCTFQISVSLSSFKYPASVRLYSWYSYWSVDQFSQRKTDRQALWEKQQQTDRLSLSVCEIVYLLSTEELTTIQHTRRRRNRPASAASSLCDAANSVTMAPNTQCATISFLSLAGPVLPPPSLLPLIYHHKSTTLNCCLVPPV